MPFQKGRAERRSVLGDNEIIYVPPPPPPPPPLKSVENQPFLLLRSLKRVPVFHDLNISSPRLAFVWC